MNSTIIKAARKKFNEEKSDCWCLQSFQHGHRGRSHCCGGDKSCCQWQSLQTKIIFSTWHHEETFSSFPMHKIQVKMTVPIENSYQGGHCYLIQVGRTLYGDSSVQQSQRIWGTISHQETCMPGEVKMFQVPRSFIKKKRKEMISL